MLRLVVIESPDEWDLNLPGVEVVLAREYLSGAGYAGRRRVRVFNFCRRFGYQSVGYYVSLLAEARGHRPLPSVATLVDLRLTSLVRIASQDLQQLIERSLAPVKSNRFLLSVYFGRNLARRYDRLSQALFDQFPAPLLRAELSNRGGWRLEAIRPIGTGDLPDSHREFVEQRAQQYLSRPTSRRPTRRGRYDLALLVDPDEDYPPSDERALRRFVRAARECDIDTTPVGRDDYGRLAEFDALFIRQTTAVNHHTFRFARRAAAEGLVVIDDPNSILCCTNKVYLAELLARHGISAPRTMIVDRGTDPTTIETALGLPCVVKRPDSAFSQGVVKADDRQALAEHLETYFRSSELLVVQAFVPSEYDWRIGVLDGAPLFACRYHMASGHWQIRATDARGRSRYGKVETVPVSAAPRGAVAQALASCRLIGDGLYGVDLKQVGRRFHVIEINDNPNIEAGDEDAVLGLDLYRRIAGLFLQRLEARGREASVPR